MLCEKEQYKTHKKAIDAVRQIAERDNVSLRVYRCNDCLYFHIATNGKRKYIKNIRTPITLPKYKRLSESEIIKARKRNHRSQMYFELATYKLISKEMAEYLKRLIEGKNQLENQKVKYGLQY